MTWVLEHSRSEHSARLVLFSLANHAGTDGGESYPSIATIARETRLGESTVRLALEKLKALGEIEEGEASARRTRCFRVNLHPADSAPPQILRPRRIERETPQDLAATPQDLRRKGAGSAPEPSVEPSLEPSGEPSTARQGAEVVKHAGKVVSADRLAVAEAIVAEFNEQAGTGYATRKPSGKATDNLSRVLAAIADHPDITMDVATRMIASQLRAPYWDGRPHLGNVFGPGVVERNLENARNPAHNASFAEQAGLARSGRPSAAERAAALEAEAEADEAMAWTNGRSAA